MIENSRFVDLKDSSGNLACKLNYHRTDVDKKAPRFAGRWYYKPEIELGSVNGKPIYKTNAVIDYLHIKFTLERKTQPRAMAWIVEKASKRRPGYPKGDYLLNSNEITLIFQEPTRNSMKQAIKAIHANNPLKAIPQVIEMEVSVDFYSAAQSEEERARMYAVLIRHIIPPRHVLATKLDRPRFVYPKVGQETLPKPKTDTKFVTRLKETPLTPNDTLLRDLPSRSKYTEAQPFNNSTFYIGEKNAGARIRAMNKVIDTQRDDIVFSDEEGGKSAPKKIRTFKELEIDQCRARIEITLKGSELADMKIVTISDLYNSKNPKDPKDPKEFKFGDLQGKYLRFWHPTFSTRTNLAHTKAIPRTEARFINKEMQDVFINAGVVPVFETQQAMQHKHENPKKHGEHRGRPRSKKGDWSDEVGKDGTLIAYTELNKRIRDALDRLSKNWR